jgi:phage terminase Nu1 subunit (DNA packaging protein)
MLYYPPNLELKNVDFAQKLIFFILKVFVSYVSRTITNILKSVPSTVHQQTLETSYMHKDTT